MGFCNRDSPDQRWLTDWTGGWLAGHRIPVQVKTNRFVSWAKDSSLHPYTEEPHLYSSELTLSTLQIPILHVHNSVVVSGELMWFLGKVFYRVACRQTTTSTTTTYTIDVFHLFYFSHASDNQLGVALGFLLPSLLVRNQDDISLIGRDFQFMFNGIAGLTTILVVLVVLCEYNEPFHSIYWCILWFGSISPTHIWPLAHAQDMNILVEARSSCAWLG